MSKSIKKADNFSIKTLTEEEANALYTDTIDVRNRVDSHSALGTSWRDQNEVLAKLESADTSNNEALKVARKLYATNSIFSRIVNYYATMYVPRYYVTPRLPDGGTPLPKAEWMKMYHRAVEYVDGLAFDVKMPELLRQLFRDGGIYFTCYFDAEHQAIDTLLLPIEYCRRIGETEYGTDVIKFDVRYLDSLGLDEKNITELLYGFPEEIKKAYLDYKSKKTKLYWVDLDPRFSSCVLLNEKCIPTLLYPLAGIRNYEAYSINELDKNSQALQTIIEHHIPTWQDKLLLEVPEMNLLHKKLSKIVSSTKNARLVTTIGDVKVHQVLAGTGTVADNTLENAYKSIYDMAGLNNGIFYGNTKDSIEASMSIDRGFVWSYIEKITNFYNLVINNLGLDLQGYQLDITMIPISRDKIDEDISCYRENAKVGVGVLPFMIASGIKQKDIDAHLDMEEKLGLVNRLTPLRSSNTMASDFDEDAKSTTTDKGAANEDEQNDNN